MKSFFSKPLIATGDRQAWQPHVQELAQQLPWLKHLLVGMLAFLVFELLLGLVLTSLGLSRTHGLFFLELLMFLSVAGIIFSHSRTNQVRLQHWTLEQNLLNSQSNHGQTYCLRNLEKFDNFSQGIADSLSAIMFYARAKSARAENAQKGRDLREIMERIDQIYLLVNKIRVLFGEILGVEADGNTETSLGESKESALQGTAKSMRCLRKSARKVSVLPVTVRFQCGPNELQFQSYTVNVCEGGACIVFSNDSDEVVQRDDVIGVDIFRGFEARASIKWIQASGESTMRLVGIEFLENKYSMQN